jgi:hypothetical protein
MVAEFDLFAQQLRSHGAQLSVDRILNIFANEEMEWDGHVPKAKIEVCL